MRIRGLLIAVTVLAVLGGLVWWSNKTKTGEGDSPKSEESPKILALKQDEIKMVEIRRTPGEITVVQREGAGPWMIIQPKEFAADPDAMTTFLASLATFNADKLVDPQTADFAPYGLKEPALMITVVMKDGKQHTVLVGDETPGTGGYYVRAGGAKSLYTIASFTKAGIDKSAADLRDKRLLTFGRDSLTRIELTAKGQTTEFGKNDHGDWQIVKPSPMRADGWQVDELLRKLSEAKLDATVSDETAKKNEAAFSSSPPFVTARLTDKYGAQSLEVRKSKDGMLVKSSAVPGIHALTADALQGIDKTAADFRNKKLFDFGFNEPSKVEVIDSGKSRVFAKSGDKWDENGKTMDSIGVQSLIDRLRDLTAAGFPAAGFAQPEVTISVYSGKRVEKVAISNSGGKFFARREGEPALYELAAPDVDELRRAASDVKQSQPKPPAKK
jgi:hypothetical protein